MPNITPVCGSFFSQNLSLHILAVAIDEDYEMTVCSYDLSFIFVIEVKPQGTFTPVNT